MKNINITICAQNPRSRKIKYHPRHPYRKENFIRCSIKSVFEFEFIDTYLEINGASINEKRLARSPPLVLHEALSWRPLHARKIRRKFGRCSAIPNFYGAVTAPPVIPTYPVERLTQDRGSPAPHVGPSVGRLTRATTARI